MENKEFLDFDDLSYYHEKIKPGLNTPDGNTIIKNADGTISAIGAKGAVTGIKGQYETEYKDGNVTITKSTVGLGNVDNTPDSNKPVSIPTREALSKKITDYSITECNTDRAELTKAVTISDFILQIGARVLIKFTNNGTTAPTKGSFKLNVSDTGSFPIRDAKSAYSVCSFNVDTWFCNNQIHEFIYDGSSWILTNSEGGSSLNPIAAGVSYDNTISQLGATTLQDAIDELAAGGGSGSSAVSGVKGSAEEEFRTGNVSISASDIGLGNVDNTSDAEKPMSDAANNYLGAKPYDSTKQYYYGDFCYIYNRVFRCIYGCIGIEPLSTGANNYWEDVISALNYTQKISFDNYDKCEEVKALTGSIYNDNLLNPTLATTTINGITCTNNGDGTYILDGTASALSVFALCNIPIGSYKLLGCPSGASNSTYFLQAFSDGYIDKSDYGNGIEISNTDATKNVSCRIVIMENVTVSNLVFKPMITTNLKATYNDFVPYKLSRKSLREDIDSGVGSSGVTGVKGDSETEYRKGQVNITKANIGLGNVDNTSDDNKPVSAAARRAINEVKGVFLTQAEYDALSNDKLTDGIPYHITDNNTITAVELELDKVDNTSDLDKPVSTATQAAIDNIKNIIAQKWYNIYTYPVGTFVIYENDMYKCKTQNTGIEPSNSGYWTRVTIEEMLKLYSTQISNMNTITTFSVSPVSGMATIYSAWSGTSAKKNGICYLNVCLNIPNTVTGGIIATIPSGFRPKYEQAIPIGINSGAIKIDTSGNILGYITSGNLAINISYICQ